MMKWDILSGLFSSFNLPPRPGGGGTEKGLFYTISVMDDYFQK